ncbi:MAG: hypothetical protein BGO78_15495 [Chloroflexi bacterium 44-23]|nr:MAG: hypothetical protein BGO78_15495 [Chloroflexi bacterium 44-23]
MQTTNTTGRKRKIIHMDLDAFFCAVEELKNPALSGKCFAVGGSPDQRGVIASCSYAARRYGVHSAMPTAQAIKLCPKLILVSSRHDEYSQISSSVMAILAELTPVMEQVSIDEAFLEVTDLADSGEIIAKNLQYKIKEQTGLSASFGVNSNKLVAKIANDFGKKQSRGDTYPGAIQVVEFGKEAEFMAPLPVAMLWGVGPKTTQRLGNIGVKTIGDLAKLSENSLVELFGKNGVFLRQRAMGIDDSDVESYEETKSISQEVTFNRDIVDVEVLLAEIKEISEKLGYKLRSKKLLAQSVRVKFRYYDFRTFTRQKKLSQPVNQDGIIYDAASQILTQNWDLLTPVRLIGVGVSQLSDETFQLSLWETDEARERKLLTVIDTLKVKYGRDIIRKASRMKKGENNQEDID